tara:strand:+ start:4488 stop:5018 length:531 start_codon:yes stop_codon:yes gene_type:complete
MIIFNKTEIPDVVTFKNKEFQDDRGTFMEVFNKNMYDYFQCDFVQDNYVKTVKKHVIRGMHFQIKEPQAKLIRVVKGEILDVAVDLRKDSPNFKKWVSRILSDVNMLNMFIPVGFAHGYCTLTENTEVFYKCSNYYNKIYDAGFLWSDENINIKWPTNNPIISKKDQNLPNFKEIM